MDSNQEKETSSIGEEGHIAKNKLPGPSQIIRQRSQTIKSQQLLIPKLQVRKPNFSGHLQFLGLSMKQ